MDVYSPKFDYPEGVEKNQTVKEHIVDFIQSIVVMLAIFALIYLFIAQPHKVSGSSMVPTFHNGDYILTDKVTYHLSSPAKGDVIVLKNPRDESQDFIKRIIALPGETLSVSGNHVFVNGKQISEPYLKSDVNTISGNFLHEGEELKVGPNQYFVFGDNRGASSDSREWGPITKEEIIGRVIFRYWPPTTIGPITAPSI